VPVVDASVVVDWVAPGSDPAGPARGLLDQLSATESAVHGPILLLQEVGNALLTGVRRGRWSGDEADRAYLQLSRLPVELVDTPRDVTRAYELSRRFDEHPLYDMVYVAIAERLGQSLYTADRRLVERLSGFADVTLVGEGT
jgi:predicted nucleic acid-binding protein